MDFPEKGLNQEQQLSIEDKELISKVEKGSTMVDGHYCVALPFKEGQVKLPNNWYLAEKRLKSLQKRLTNDDKYKQEYCSYMEGLVEKGFAEKVPVGEVTKNRQCWYVPHHGVYHPQKQKLRVVFDCAAKAEGVSLNDCLLPGPNLTNSLLGVLLRFRQGKIALVADIEAMFWQVIVPVKDRDFLRYIWHPDSTPEVYRMKVHTFGATCSPSCANFALKKTADDNKDDFPKDVIETVKNNFYVDDLLKSLDNPEMAIEMVEHLRRLCRRGGFNLTKWSSSNKGVIQSVPEDQRSTELKGLNLNQELIPTERTLGINCDLENDVFQLSTPSVTRQQNIWTRRHLLSVMSSVFDPMGLMSPVVLPAKDIFQRSLSLKDSGWDDPFSKELQGECTKWWSELQRLWLLDG
ncbi:uncharacterized protein [Antedon mediterranea]|uniref:uncharacterized protein n=1 Tax=Antedon mediterranea TaxID=105859 RepID=UPI003AF65171